MNLADNQMRVMGYTEHSVRHVGITAQRVTQILTKVGCGQREMELGQIAAFMHDIGNSVNRDNHPQSGALLAYGVLCRMGMAVGEAGEVMTAIGNHDEKDGKPVSRITAALIIADKSDVHRSRVRKEQVENGHLREYADIHDRVNYAVEHNELDVNEKTKEIMFKLDIDTDISTAMDYFDIFLERMRMCKNAATFLGFQFKMSINNSRLV
jgi:metal-dependent HD superfamily phosphatase/phosphodiesterase